LISDFVRIDEINSNLGGVLELDWTLDDSAFIGRHGSLPARSRRRHRVGQGAGRQYKDPLTTRWATKRLVADGALASDAMTKRTGDAEILDLGLGGCTEPFKKASRPAQ
jgi:hypothetical protein